MGRTDMKPFVKFIRDQGAMGDRRHLVAEVVYAEAEDWSQTARVSFHGPSDGESSGPVLLMTESGMSAWVEDSWQYGPFGTEWVKRFYERMPG